jgi:hypothetical protein
MTDIQKWAVTALILAAAPLTWSVWCVAIFFFPSGAVAGTQVLWDATKTAAKALWRLHHV